ncbi:MAG: response regulator [Thaumarchaeota archaeon]|nr:MAG: response regulator [Nitrososphaerota archaeon]TLX86780.1 MAG: response regulator [Nitrososphaerota archaeon]
MKARVRVPPSTSKRIVSIVDDELDITKLFHDALSNNIDDASVVTFNDPIIALEHYAKNKERYALVIADMRMPTVNGLELLKKVKKLNPLVRTILISAYDFQNNPVFEDYLKDGIINSYIEKPIKINRLRQRIRDEFGRYELGTEI